jgi:hypothetical protein
MERKRKNFTEKVKESNRRKEIRETKHDKGEKGNGRNEECVTFSTEKKGRISTKMISKK